jgi:hypothetical protein
MDIRLEVVGKRLRFVDSWIRACELQSAEGLGKERISLTRGSPRVNSMCVGGLGARISGLLGIYNEK